MIVREITAGSNVALPRLDLAMTIFWGDYRDERKLRAMSLRRRQAMSYGTITPRTYHVEER